MKISIITVCYNSQATIAATLRSVAEQAYPSVEHIIIDGMSTDGTLSVVKQFPRSVSKVVSEKDVGIYDAMNKGVSYASGEIVAFLNADDQYVDSKVICEVVEKFEVFGPSVDYVYGDLNMLSRKRKIVRRWVTGQISKDARTFSQIPHPAFFVRLRALAALAKPFDDSYRISADLKQQLLLIYKNNANGVYIRRPLVNMALGGTSTGTASAYFRGWRESCRAYNEIFENGGAMFTVRKVAGKIKGYFFA